MGCDIDPACAHLSYDDPRIAVVIGDANSDAAQEAIFGHAKAFDIIIDDGSHRSSDIVKSFARYFPHLAYGGVFIAEDLHCSYWRKFEGGLYDPFSSITLFKRLADVINHEHWGIEKVRADILRGFFSKYGFYISEEALQAVHSVQFMNSVCVVRKDKPERNRLDRRVIAGSMATVEPEALGWHSRPTPLSDQTNNEWTARSMPPDEELKVRINELRERGARVEALSAELKDSQEAVAERDGQIAALHSSTSWRITKPLRAVSRGLRWLLRNTRRALMLAWWLGTGQFTRAARASLPYYQRYVPLRVKALIPNKLREALKWRLIGNPKIPVVITAPSLKTAVAEAETASDTKDWPEAEKRWQAVLERFGDNAAATNLAKLNISVGKRLSNIDKYKDQIAEYAKARATKALEKKGDKKKIVIYTAISGGYDSIKLPEKLDPRFDYVLFTDTFALDTGVYQVRPITYFHEDVTRVARFVKTHPHMLLEDYDIAIWIDANIMIQGDIYPLVEDFLASAKPVAAVPHPKRKSVYEEVEACIRYKMDDAEIMRKQSIHYRSMGFGHDDLIETNLMMFNLKDEGIKRFLDSWWTEIDRYSKRDQLSVNYALKQAGIEWHQLMKHPNSARNHPVFGFVVHDAGEGPASALLDALQVPVVDPYAGPSYTDVREQRIGAQKHRRIDIVVCVHNALEDVNRCLDSVRRTRNGERQKLIIIDDGSDRPTARYLEEFARNAPWIELHRNEHATGYTKAANKGLRASTGELVILLNSDTIVTDGWAKKMADSVFSTPGAGIVGPMSSAASHQSIPEHRSSKDQTAVNDLPRGLTAEDLNRYCEQWTSAHVLPRVPLVHGFCFGVTREVIDRIGFFDEDSFPKGYGEENDYCVRAVDAGFGLVVATHIYIFHAKSKSYAGPERVALMKAGWETLIRLHGRARIQRAVRSMEENPIFVNLRRRTWRLYGESPLPRAEWSHAWIPRQIDGAQRQRSVVGVIPLRADGHWDGTVYIRVLRPLRHHSLSRVLRLSLADKDREEFGPDHEHDALLIQRNAIKSPKEAKELVERCQKKKVRLIYEIDDDLLHLPDTHPAAGYYSPTVKEAMQTIIQHSDAVIVSTAPLKERMTAFNSNVFVVPNALDECLWQPADDPRRDTGRTGQVRILYMGTRTHDDDLALVIDAIKRLKEKYGDRVTFTCIGVFTKNPPEMARVENVPEWARTYPDFAKWMARSCQYDIAIAPLVDNDFNIHKSYIKYLDYGICGFAPVLSDVQPYRAVVRDGETGVLVTNTPEHWFDALCALIEDPARRGELGRNAHEDVLAHHTLAAQAEQRRRIWSEILS